MADDQVRELQRRWEASRAPEDEVALLRAQVKHGVLPERHVALAALLGHAACGAAVDPLELAAGEHDEHGDDTDVDDAGSDPLGWISRLEGFGADVLLRLAVGAARQTEEVWRALDPAALGEAVGDVVRAGSRQHDDLPLGRSFATAPWAPLEDWLLCPCDAHAATIDRLHGLLGQLMDREALEPAREAMVCIRWACSAVKPGDDAEARLLLAIFGEDLFDEDRERRRAVHEAACSAAAALERGGDPEPRARVMQGVRDELIPWLLGRGDPVAARAQRRPAGAVLDPGHIVMAPRTKAEEVVAALEPWREAHRRPAWFPDTPYPPEDGGPADSKLGGVPWLAPGEAWPACSACGAALPLLLQLDLATLPVALPGDAGLLQLFFCTQRGCGAESWDPTSGAGKLVRVVRPRREPRALTPEEAAACLPGQRVEGWRQAAPTTPDPAEHERLGLVYEYDFDAGTVTFSWPSGGVRVAAIQDGLLAEKVSSNPLEDRLGGWPNWVQGAGYPPCSVCSRPMEFLFQLTSGEKPYMFGDCGVGRVFRCASHRDVVAFGWDCS